MNSSRLLTAFAVGAFGAGSLAFGCSGTAGTTDVDNGFESDNPGGTNSASQFGAPTAGGDNAGADASTASPADPSGQRAIEEADIINVQGNQLYALSRYGGLSVVDITDPDHMKVAGRKRTQGEPFEMYVQNGRAYVMLNSYGHWIEDAGSVYGRWVETSELLTLDVHDPTAISEVAHYDVPGTISDSRIIGNVLYLITYEGGYCYNCGSMPSTIVTSFDVSNGISEVDQLAYTAPTSSYSGWQRSVSATDQRLYIAGPQWDWTPGMQGAHSIIQVVDITDPAGHLKKGADVPVAGQINSRWQMDEYSGVLRVISQFGNGWGPSGSVNPKIQTFTVASATSITPLASTDLVLPMPESLQSVRFDGTRGYAITSQRRDPLFTIDVSDPAHPRQAGQVSMPGWIFHMEPRGDRLVGFGFDQPESGNSPVAVSLFDVSDLNNPSMLSRVTFGSGWTTLPEDQNRIQKAVSVLDDQGLVLVPFASYGTWSDNGCSVPASGIQLIDYSRSALTLRGLAPQHGQPRRAFIANGRLLGMSDRNVTSFDITSRDTPTKTGQIDLSNPAYRMTEVGGYVASVTNDWWTGEVMLSLTPRANADDATITGKLSLASLADPDPSLCGSTSGWASWYEARLFANGNVVYVVVPVYWYDQNASGGKVVVAAIDVSNPAAPVLASKADMLLTPHVQGGTSYFYAPGGYAFWDGYDYYSFYGGVSGSVVGTGDGVVQLGSKLAYLEVYYESTPTVVLAGGQKDYETKVHRVLHVADMGQPGSPSVPAPIALPDSLGSAPLQLADGVVMTSRWIPGSNPNKVRFFVDRVDIAGESPVRLASINTPGSLVQLDGPSQHLVTMDYSAQRGSAADWTSCQAAFGWRAQFDYQTHECVSISRTVKLSEKTGTTVTLMQTLVPPSQNIAGVVSSEDRVYVTRYPRYGLQSVGPNGSYTPPTVLDDGGLWAIGGIRDGHLAIVSQMTADTNWPLAASGTKIALYNEWGMAIYDTATPTPTLVNQAQLRGWGYASQVMLESDRAICSLADFGLQTIRY